MRRLTTTLALLLAAALVSLAPAKPAAALGRGINDAGEFFTDAAEKRAMAVIDNIFQKHGGEEVLVETFQDLPAGKALDEFARERATGAKLSGLYVIVVRKGSQVGVLPDTRLAHVINHEASSQLRLAFLEDLKKGPKNFDAALMNFVDAVQARLDRAPAGSTAAPPAAVPGSRSQGSTPAGSPGQQGNGGLLGFLPSGIMGYVCLAIGIWVIIALVRAVMARRSAGYGGQGGPGYGGGGGGPGYGGGGGYGYGGGGYGGGGGGGWGTSIMGGLFGAMAGNWLYDRFSGGSSHAQQMPPMDQGGGAMGGGGGTEAGGDFSGGGGSFGGGGGDFGNAGDAGGGGGGDFGGGAGGGDFGGGGGGDVGGGGGGDFGGGGGGDFGGGGGDFGG